MKMNSIKLVLLVAIAALGIQSCDKAVFTESTNVKIVGNVQDIAADEGVEYYTLILDDVYRIENEAGMQPDNIIYANSNPGMIEAEMVNRMLILRVVTGQTGSAEITIRSRVGNVYRDDRFSVTITAITSEQTMTRAISHFSAGAYDLAESHFKLAVVKNDPVSLADAYMGMGYSRMRLGSAEYNYGYQDLLISRGLNPANTDAIAGLSLLEYAVMENYQQAIHNGNEVLEKSPDFVFRYDIHVDKNDVLLNIALSQYQLQLFADCSSSIKRLDPASVLDPSASDFRTQLYEKLQQLIDTYK